MCSCSPLDERTGCKRVKEEKAEAEEEEEDGQVRQWQDDGLSESDITDVL